MEYTEFLETKQKSIIKSGFDIDNLNKHLFPFQKFIVKKALKQGKYAIFSDTGTGKTIMQLEWANQVSKFTKKPILILAPLAVAEQTIGEGMKFNIKVNYYGSGNIQITNYEQINNIDFTIFSGIVLDESSILKNETGKYRNYLIETCKNTPYKLACTATPSPNDPMELGNHSEFLDVMDYSEMLAMFFVHDSDNTSQWRLKGHAIDKFYEFVSQWAIMLMKPEDIGFSQSGFDLPKLNLHEIQVNTGLPEGFLFGGTAVNATDFNRSLRNTESLRINEVTTLVEKIGKSDQIIIWCKQNQESDNLYKALSKLGYDCRNVKGSDNQEKKRNDLLGFAHNEFRILITKAKIAQFGMNYQNCHYQIFASIDFSFESTYQAIRRSWRFKQDKEVNIYLITTDRMINIMITFDKKQKQFKAMQEQMTKAVNKNLKGEITESVDVSEDVKTEFYHLMKGDCVQRIKELENSSIDFMVFSPPFADLYTYSNYVEDMGNVNGYEEFIKHFKYLVTEIKRVLKTGRLCAVHCMDLPTLKSRIGYNGINRFSSYIADCFEHEDMYLHSEFTIWKDPLLAATRTKAIGLAHRQVVKDMSMIRTGLADKVMVFKKKGENKEPIQLKDKRFTSYIPMHNLDKFPKTIEGFNEFYGYNPDSDYNKNEQFSHMIWQRYASPVWMDIRQTDVLQYTTARGKNDEKHICPLQLGLIRRLILLYSNEGEIVLSPFGGIGSEGYTALLMGRRSISIELKDSYFIQNIRNHRSAIEQLGQQVLF